MITTCHQCGTFFDATKAPWCNCLVPLRTLRCPSCRSCFCSAPMPYKRRFWVAAPRELSQHPDRFFVQLGATAARFRRHANMTRPVVLVIDDDEAMRSMVAYFVEQLGYEVRTEDDARRALHEERWSEIDVVITDALMPRLDGREFCRQLKATPEGVSKKVILMTS